MRSFLLITLNILNKDSLKSEESAEIKSSKKKKKGKKESDTTTDLPSLIKQLE
jgi:hypothetical protein